LNEIKIASKIFDGISRVYDFFLNFATAGQIKKWQDFLVSNTPLKENIIDIGTGTGEILKIVKEKKSDSKCIGVDLSLKMLKKAKEKLKNHDNIIFIKASALNLPIRDEIIDNAFFSLTLRHLDIHKTLKEVNRILSKNGYISILEIGKPKSEKLYKFILFFSDKIFRPFGRLIFSKEEYDYFIDSIKNSFTLNQLEEIMFKYNFEKHKVHSFLFGTVIVAIYKKGNKE
jgi:demethylmenaquinone methyltransferase/2-methoxy-6-polyprenyl-1,4-benzoquinol methylase